MLANITQRHGGEKEGGPELRTPRMQPDDHMSTENWYFVEPSRISGARYQRVAT